jgi:hypothetical protein
MPHYYFDIKDGHRLVDCHPRCAQAAIKKHLDYQSAKGMSDQDRLLRQIPNLGGRSSNLFGRAIKNKHLQKVTV